MSTPGGVVLVVDDEPDLLELVADELKLHGYEVLCAPGGTAALDLLSTKRVDAIVSDVRMPEGDGVELFEGVKTRFKDSIPFIFMTGFPDISVQEAMKKGARALIAKPFDLGELVEQVRIILGFQAPASPIPAAKTSR